MTLERSNEAPTANAKALSVGTVKRGSDGAAYAVVETASGRRRWRRVLSKSAERGLEEFWMKLARGELVVTIDGGGRPKRVAMPQSPAARRKMWDGVVNDPSVKTVLTSSMSRDAWERLRKIAEKRSLFSPSLVLKHWDSVFLDSWGGGSEKVRSL